MSRRTRPSPFRPLAWFRWNEGRRCPLGTAAHFCGVRFGPIQAQGLCSSPMKCSSLAVLLGSLCVLSTAQATTYVRVEKDGTKTYSDRPIPGGQVVDLQPAQTYSVPAASGYTPRSSDSNELTDFRYDSCPISPQHDSTFTNP